MTGANYRTCGFVLLLLAIPFDALAQDGQGTPQQEHFVFRQRPSFRFGDAFRIDLTLTLQEDIRDSYDGAELTAGLTTFDLRRARVGIQGNFFGRIDYEIERELTTRDLDDEPPLAGIEPKTRWQDVRVDVNFVTALQVQVGRFKVPFGLDRLTGVTNTDFAYRSLGAQYLSPGRAVGGMVHGRLFRRGLNYWVGGFGRDGDNARSKRIHGAGATFAARVTGTPFRALAGAALDNLAVGAALTDSELTNDGLPPNGLRGRTVMTEETFFEPVYVSGRRRRVGGEIDWTTGPASVRAEYIRVTDDRVGQGIRDEDLPDARYRSWYISGTYLVTGETKDRPVRPRRDLFRGGIGAIELAVRYESIRYDSAGGTDEPFRNPRAETILPNGDRVLTLGVNWMVNRWVTVRINGLRERLEDPDRNPTPGGGAFWSRIVRVQLAL